MQNQIKFNLVQKELLYGELDKRPVGDKVKRRTKIQCVRGIIIEVRLQQKACNEEERKRSK